MAVTKGPPISGSTRQYGPKGVTKPVNTGYGPPVKKAQLPNALEVCNKIESDNLIKLQTWYDQTGSSAALVELNRYKGVLQKTCEERAREKGYFDPIGDIFDFLFGGDDQASNFRHSPTSPTWPPSKPTPDGGQMPIPAPPPAA